MLLRILRRRLIYGVELPSPEVETKDSEKVLVLPKPVYDYAKRTSELTGLPLEEVLYSQPVVEYWRRYKEEAIIRIGKASKGSRDADDSE